MEKVLIGIHGKPHAGKDTLAEHLVSKYELLRYGPSVPVKKVTAAMFNIDERILHDNDRKDTFDPFWQMSYREMMQKVGKECSRDIFGDNFWMRHVEKMWEKIQRNELGFGGHFTNGMILSDIRYANEVMWVKQHGGLVIFITREERGYVANETHPADRGLMLDLADVVIPNNGSREELYAKSDWIIEPLIGV